MSEHPTERFERPPVPSDDPDTTTREYPGTAGTGDYREDYNPLFDPPPGVTEGIVASGAAPEPPPAAPPPPPVTPEPPPMAAEPPPVTPEPPPPTAAAPSGTAEPPPKREPKPSAAATIARQWFSQSDNVLMAVTALVAAAFLVLVAVLP